MTGVPQEGGSRAPPPEPSDVLGPRQTRREGSVVPPSAAEYQMVYPQLRKSEPSDDSAPPDLTMGPPDHERGHGGGSNKSTENISQVCTTQSDDNDNYDDTMHLKLVKVDSHTLQLAVPAPDESGAYHKSVVTRKIIPREYLATGGSPAHGAGTTSLPVKQQQQLQQGPAPHNVSSSYIQPASGVHPEPAAPKPSGGPRMSPRLSPRLHHAAKKVVDIKRKFSEAISHENIYMSDHMHSLSFKSLEAYIYEDNLEGMAAFLSSRTVVIDDHDENGTTALMTAAQLGKAEFCNVLILKGADVNGEDNDQWSPLITAAKEGHNDVVVTLLSHSANIHHKEMGGWTALMWASYKGHTNITKLLLLKGSDPNHIGPHNMTSMMWATGRGHTEIVHALLQHNAKINVTDKFGTSPLIWACRKGYYEIAEALLKNGANVDVSGMYSWTPLLVATMGNYVDLVHLLLEYKPNVNALDKDHCAALTIACREGYADIASALLNSGAYVNTQDRTGDSNLIYAARGGHRQIVESLLHKYADVDLVGKEKKTPLYWAVEKKHTAVVKILLSANPDLEFQTKESDTALLRAVRTKNAEVVQMLIDKKVRVSVTDKKGDTALHIAMRSKSKKIVEILLRNPKNSQLLYRPNRAGETPYNMDLSNQKTIMGQIFGARRLNTNEDNEDMLGYDLYSSSLADILSEPSLSMPISVGLYAKWGSGKSFLIRKLKEEMDSFAKQWVEPLFQFSPLVFVLILHLAILVGLVTAVPTFDWRIGVAASGVVFFVILLCLMAVWHGARSYDWDIWFKWSVLLEEYMESFKLVMQVIFCSPPGSQWKAYKEEPHAKPLKFIFAECAKPSSTADGENSVVQMLGSLFDMAEKEYGLFATRFYRAFRPKSFNSLSPWKYRRLCCMPYIVIFFFTLFCTAICLSLIGLYGIHAETPYENEVESSRNRRDTHDFDLGDDDDDDDDDDSNEETGNSIENEEGTEEYFDGYIDLRPYHGALLNPLLITMALLVAVVIVANISTLARMFRALLFSHRRHLLRSLAKLDTLKAEGYLHILKAEVNLLIDMIRCLDAFTMQQTRMVVVVDGLDSCEQEKVLSVLDATNTLLTDSNAPFIILLAIDPHIITKAIELHVHRVFSESSISGHDYLRNIVHLPFYLQNSGLMRVKQAQLVAERYRGKSQATWMEHETDSVSLATAATISGISHNPRKISNESHFSIRIPANRKLSDESARSVAHSIRRNNSRAGSRRRALKPMDSVASSIGSGNNKNSEAQDLTKVLLTDDYFSDINPRSMRRLMNVVYITGRLLKAFQIDFNWYHLASWINITEQWPYRASWIILYYESHEEALEDKISLLHLYDKIKLQVPNSKDMEPLLEMDKEEKKFELFLSMHKSNLHVSDIKIFLPFTINLDPVIRKAIKEEQPQFDEFSPEYFASTNASNNPWSFQNADTQNKPSTTEKKNTRMTPVRGHQRSTTNSLSQMNPPALNPMMWGYGGHFVSSSTPVPSIGYNESIPSFTRQISLPVEASEKKLSAMDIDELCEILVKVNGMSATSLPAYKKSLIENNINGKVLMHCNLDDLKKVLKMSFGDWELFRMMIVSLREREVDDDFPYKNVRFQEPPQHSYQIMTCDTSVGPSSLSSGGSSIPISVENGSLSQRQGSTRGSSQSYSSPSSEDTIVVSRGAPQQTALAKQGTVNEAFVDDDDPNGQQPATNVGTKPQQWV